MTEEDVNYKFDAALGEQRANGLRRRIVEIYEQHGFNAASEACEIANTLIDQGRANYHEIVQAIRQRWPYDVGDWVRIQLIGFNNQPFTAQARIESIQQNVYTLSIGADRLEFTQNQIIERIPVEDIYPS